jgi:hypothetical protein
MCRVSVQKVFRYRSVSEALNLKLIIQEILQIVVIRVARVPVISGALIPVTCR